MTALFLRKKNVPTKVERVPKWNDQERIPLVFWNAFLIVRFFGTRHYYLYSHFLQKSSKRCKWSSHLIRRKTCPSTTRRAISNGVLWLFVDQTVFQNPFSFFFKSRLPGDNSSKVPPFLAPVSTYHAPEPSVLNQNWR